MFVLLGSTLGTALLPAPLLSGTRKLSEIPDTLERAFTSTWPTVLTPMILALGLAFLFALQILDVKVAQLHLNTFAEGDVRSAMALGAFGAFSGERSASLIKGVFGTAAFGR